MRRSPGPKLKRMSADFAMDWWERRRLKYNIGLVVAGVLASACYVLVVDRGISSGAMPGAEITLFTTAFQAVGYLFMNGKYLLFLGGFRRSALYSAAKCGALSTCGLSTGLLVFGTPSVQRPCAGRLVLPNPYFEGCNAVRA